MIINRALWNTLGAILILITISAEISAQELVIIANKNVMTDTLSTDDIENIFLGKRSQWADNKTIAFAILQDERLHELFVRKYMNRSSSQFLTYWRKQVFTGKGVLPARLNTDEMLTFVSGTEGAIGYLSAEDVTQAVKIIKTP